MSDDYDPQSGPPDSASDAYGHHIPVTSQNSGSVAGTPGNDGGRISQSPSSTGSGHSGFAEAGTSQQVNPSVASLLSQKPRKLAPRSRMDNDGQQAKTMSSSVAVNPTQIIAAPSSLGNNTYFFRNPEGQWFVLQVNPQTGAPIQQPELQPQQAQVQYSQPQPMPSHLLNSSFFNGTATLGQLAKSLVPASSQISSGVSTVPAMYAHPGSMAQQSALRPRLHQMASIPPPQSPAVSHFQALRPAVSLNPQLVSMINNYYGPSGPSTVSAPSLVSQSEGLVSLPTITEPLPQHAENINQTGFAQPQFPPYSTSSADSATRQPSQNVNQQQMANTPVEPTQEVLRPRAGRSNAAPAVRAMRSPKSSTTFVPIKQRPRGKGRGRGEKVLQAPVPALVRPGIAANQNQMIWMPGSSNSQVDAVSAYATPIACSGEQPIRQQVMPTSSLPGQVPVFRQHQNIPQFAPTQSSHISGFVQPTPDGSPETDTENESPTIDCCDKSKEAHKVRTMFVKEIESFREQLGTQHQIVHCVDGVEILESEMPFPSLPPVPLEDWMPRVQENAAVNDGLLNDFTASPGRNQEKNNNLEEELPVDASTVPSDSIIKPAPKRGRAAAKGKTTKSSVKADESPEKSPAETKKRRKRRTNEVDKLLQSDFGAEQGRRRVIVKNPGRPGKKRRGRKAKASSENEETDETPMPVPQVETQPEEQPVEKPAEEAVNVAGSSLNTSVESVEDLGDSVGNISLSNEDLAVERCVHCDGFLRVKRLASHPQYCSRKCRKLSKKEHDARPADMSPQQLNAGATSNISKVISTAVSTAAPNIVAPRNDSVVTPLEVKAPPARKLILNMGTMGGPEAVSVATSSAAQEATAADESRHPRTWTCDDVALWVTNITGADSVGEMFRSQEVDGQSLFLMAESDEGFTALLTQKLHLKLGPALKLEKALKHITAM